MAEAQVMDRPQRWDLPFGLDVASAARRHEMTGDDVDRLMDLEPFRSMDPGRFPRSVPLRGILGNDTRICRYRKGEVIVRQGDYGNSAFLILTGKVRVVLAGLDPVTLGRRRQRPRSRLRSLLQLFTNNRSVESRDSRQYPQVQQRQSDSERSTIPLQDVTGVLTVSDDALAQTTNNLMVEGELFGESAALGRIPRAATVVADGDAELLELRWQGLRDLRKFDETLRQHIDEQYRKIGLSSTLRSTPLLAGLDNDKLQRIAESARFETFGQFDWYGTYQQLRAKGGDDLLAQEPIIAEEDHYPDGLILIRAGFARLSCAFGSGELTFSYLGKGDVYGLAELAHNARNEDQVPLSATLRAVGFVDIVRIPTVVCEELILPGLSAAEIPQIVKPADPTLRESRQPGQVGSDMMEFLVENRFINGTSTMLIDLDRCTRCDDCVRACASGHDNNPRFIRHGKILGHYMVANACMHCVDPVCMIGCPTGAIHRGELGGEVVINDITCIGCNTCAAACPYDNIRMVEVRDRAANDAIMVDPERGKPIVKATKCDLCVDHVGGPACVRACPHDAMARIDMRDPELLGKWLGRR